MTKGDPHQRGASAIAIVDKAPLHINVHSINDTSGGEPTFRWVEKSGFDNPRGRSSDDDRTVVKRVQCGREY